MHIMRTISCGSRLTKGFKPVINPSQLTIYDGEEAADIPIADVEGTDTVTIKEHTRQRKKSLRWKNSSRAGDLKRNPACF